MLFPPLEFMCGSISRAPPVRGVALSVYASAATGIIRQAGHHPGSPLQATSRARA
jgi:hypothetical protein